ncbi:DUF86 domain-containing protein [Alicyclobacillus curvatus]|nr:DUF86 domain-containing protein [Alicyclobacillus curvatus]
MPDDVILNKLAIIKRCVQRIEEEYNGDPANLENYTKQDSIVLNVQRACEACIDVAMYLVSEKNLGLPQSSRDAFQLLQKDHLIPDDLAARMKAMVGFRNIAVHNYQSLDTSILQSVIDHHLSDFQTFSDAILKLG